MSGMPVMDPTCGRSDSCATLKEDRYAHAHVVTANIWTCIQGTNCKFDCQMGWSGLEGGSAEVEL